MNNEGANLSALTVTLASATVGAVALFLYSKLSKSGRKPVPGPPFSLLKVGEFGPFDKAFPHEEILPPNPNGQYGGIFGLWIGADRMIFINDVDIALEMLVKKGADFANRMRSQTFDILSEGYKDIALTDYTETWKLHRKLAFQALRNFMSGDNLEAAIYDSFEKMTLHLDKQTEPIDDTRRYLQFMMYNTLSRICLNHEYENIEDKEFIRVSTGVDDGNEYFLRGIFEDYFPFLKPFWKSHGYKKLEFLMEDLVIVFKKYIDDHKSTIDFENPRDIIDHLLIAQKEIEDEGESAAEITDIHLRQTLLDLFIAGTDTTTYTTYWAVFFLAYYPEIQERVFQEIEEVCGLDEYPNLSHKSKLPYTDATLHEVMRRGTIAYLNLPHTTRCDTTLGDYDIPKNANVLVNIYAIHHDPKEWDQPFEFRPERFLVDGPDGQQHVSPKMKAFMPFSAGVRSCLGQSVAKVDTFILLCLLVQRYKFNWPENEPRPAPEKMYKPFAAFGCPVDFKVKVVKRNK